MAKKIIKLPSISRIASGSVAVLELPIGPTYERVFLVATASSGLSIGLFGRIEVIANAKVIQQYKTAQRLADLNAYYSRGVDAFTSIAAEFAIHFERAELHDLAYRRAPGIGTADLATFNVEVTLGTLPAGFTLTAYAEIDPMPQPLGIFTRIREFPFNAPAAGVVEMDKFPRSGLYQAIHMAKSDVKYVELEANGVRIIDSSKDVLHRVAKEGSPLKRVPQSASYTHLDLCTDGDLANALKADGLGDMRLKMNCDTSGTFDLITETLDSLLSI